MLSLKLAGLYLNGNEFQVEQEDFIGEEFGCEAEACPVGGVLPVHELKLSSGLKPAIWNQIKSKVPTKEKQI